MKGFVISIEAVFGLIIAVILLLTTTAYFTESKFNSLNEVKLEFVSKDILTVLEKNGKLEKAVKENKNKEIGKYLNKTSNNLCFELNLFDFDNSSSALSTVTKKGCKNQGNYVISTKRSFFENEKIYWAELKSWYK